MNAGRRPITGKLGRRIRDTRTNIREVTRRNNPVEAAKGNVSFAPIADIRSPALRASDMAGFVKNNGAQVLKEITPPGAQATLVAALSKRHAHKTPKISSHLTTGRHQSKWRYRLYSPIGILRFLDIKPGTYLY
jgi:hypothetical protein